MSTLILGLVLFLGVHSISIINATWRDRAIARIGFPGWQALYAVVAIAGLVMMIKGYGVARLNGPILYTTPPWLNYLAIVLQVVVFPLLLATYLPGRIQATVKHPMLAGTKAWALAHLLVNGGVADVMLFGGFLAWAVADRISLKRRTPAPPPGAPASRFNDAVAVILGLAVYAAFLFGLHQHLFGVPPLPG